MAYQSNQFTIYDSAIDKLADPPFPTSEYEEITNWYHNDYLPTIQSNSEDFFQDFDKTASVKVEPPQVELPKPENEVVWPSQKVSSETSEIVQYFMNKGLTENQARGIYGNIMQESGGKLSIVSKDGHGSYGLAQWTGDRKKRLFSMYGNKPTKQQQLDFLWWELNNTHIDALNALKRTSTIAEATKVFMDKFEKPHKDYAALPRRIKYATGPLKAKQGAVLKYEEGDKFTYEESDPEIVKRYVTLLNSGIPQQVAFDASHMSIIEKGQKGYYAFGKHRSNLKDWGKAAADSLTTGLYKDARDAVNFSDYIKKVRSKGYNNRPAFWKSELPKGREVDKQRVNLWNKQNGLQPVAQLNSFSDNLG